MELSSTHISFTHHTKTVVQNSLPRTEDPQGVKLPALQVLERVMAFHLTAVAELSQSVLLASHSMYLCLQKRSVLSHNQGHKADDEQHVLHTELITHMYDACTQQAKAKLGLAQPAQAHEPDAQCKIQEHWLELFCTYAPALHNLSHFWSR